MAGRTFLLYALVGIALVGCKKSQGTGIGQGATGFSPDRALPPFPSSQPSPGSAMNEVDRRAIMRSIDKRWPYLREPEPEQLELLLSHYGREIWPDAPTPITDQWLETFPIISCEALQRGATYFSLFKLRNTGTLTIAHAYAEYTPPGAATPTRRASTLGLAGDPGPGKLSHDEFDVVSSSLGARFAVMSTDEQLLTLRRAFLTPGYLLNMTPITVPMSNVLIEADQTIEVGSWPSCKGRFTVLVCNGAKLTIEMNGKSSGYSPPQTDKQQ